MPYRCDLAPWLNHPLSAFSVNSIERFNFVLHRFFNRLKLSLFLMYVTQYIANFIRWNYSWSVYNFLLLTLLSPLIGFENTVHVSRRINAFKSLLVVCWWKWLKVLSHLVFIFIDYWLLEILSPFIASSVVERLRNLLCCVCVKWLIWRACMSYFVNRFVWVLSLDRLSYFGDQILIVRLREFLLPILSELSRVVPF